MTRARLSNPLVLKALGQELERLRVAGLEEHEEWTEHQHAVRFMQWLRGYAVERWPALDLMFAVPNGGARNKVVAAKMKAEGQRAGVADYMIPVPTLGGLVNGLFLELKRFGERPTPEQVSFLKGVEGQGYEVKWAQGWVSAANKIVGYMERT